MKYIQKAYCSFIQLCYLFWRKSLQTLLHVSRSTYGDFWICISPHTKITGCPCFLHIHPHAPPPHPSWIPAVACCLPQSSALQYGLSPAPCTSPLLSWDWNLNTDTWFLSNTDRSKPCIGSELVKSHRMASVAGGIMPGIAMDPPKGSVAKCQSSGFMNAIHRFPWLLAFSKARCKSLPSSSMHTLKEKVHFFLTALPEQH